MILNDPVRREKTVLLRIFCLNKISIMLDEHNVPPPVGYITVRIRCVWNDVTFICASSNGSRT